MQRRFVNRFAALARCFVTFFATFRAPFRFRAAAVPRTLRAPFLTVFLAALAAGFEGFRAVFGAFLAPATALDAFFTGFAGLAGRLTDFEAFFVALAATFFFPAFSTAFASEAPIA